jgi:hypothetical protein
MIEPRKYSSYFATFLVAATELAQQIVEEFIDLLSLPLVLTLEFVNSELLAL